MRQVLVQQFEISSTIALRVFDLLADFTDRLSFPSHLDRRKSPARMPGDTLEGHPLADEHVVVSFEMTAAARIARNTTAVRPASGGRRMRVHVVALRGSIACGVAVHATRTHDHFRGLCE